MRISRIYTPQALQQNSIIELDGPRSHYISRVLRLGKGAELCLFNGEGQEYTAQISDVAKKHTTVAIGTASNPNTESALNTILGLGISRGERMDYAIQKSTELGVSTIVPLFTENCEVKLNAERLEKRLEHWRQIAISACEQCGRTRIPELVAAVNLDTWLASETAGLKLVLDHRQSSNLSQERPESGVALLIGPEGGLSDKEISQAHSAGFEGLRLGPRVLRTETAPIVALSVLQYLWA